MSVLNVPPSGAAPAAAPMAVDRRILDRYPEPLRIAYRSVLRERDLALRHKALIEFAESGLEYLTSIIFSTYRNQSWSFPSKDVEGCLAGLSNLTFGKSLELLRLSFDRLEAPIFDVGEVPLPANQKLGQAIAGINEAIELEASNIRRLVEARLNASPAKLSWFQAYASLVNYRNRAEGHSRSHRWPVGHVDYYPLMCPLLEASVVELITAPGIADYLLHTCTGTMLSSDGPTASGGYLFDVEYQGAPMRVHGRLDEAQGAVFPESLWSKVDPRLYLLSSRQEGEVVSNFVIEGQFHDFGRHGLPTALTVAESPTPSSSPALGPTGSLKGHASAAGTCGELVQGILPGGVSFHVTCPVSKSATVALELTPTEAWIFSGGAAPLGKLRASVRAAAELLGIGPYHVEVEHHTDLDVGKGLGSSTADIVAGARAVAAAVGTTLTPEQLAKIATTIESSDGSMYPGLVAFGQKTGEVVRLFEWWPQFAIVMVVPRDTLNTESADFAGKEAYAGRFERMLDTLAYAASAHDPMPFAAAATESAVINQEFVPNAWFDLLMDRAAVLGGAGVNVGHTGTVTGMLFPLPAAGEDNGRVRTEAMGLARAAARALSDDAGAAVDVKLVTTPGWLGGDSARL